jgi:hypothetical protein
MGRGISSGRVADGARKKEGPEKKDTETSTQSLYRASLVPEKKNKAGDMLP